MEQINPAIVIEVQPAKPVAASLQVIDLAISKAKFDQEVEQFLDGAEIHRKRGIIVLDYAFPDIKLAFCAPQIIPTPIVFAVNINYTNYDMEPLSVKFIDPFTFRLISVPELRHQFGRRGPVVNGKGQIQPLALGLPDGTPFICLPGIREYHNHPDHSNDPWLTHRGKGGEGTLGFIIEKLHQYGIASLNGYLLQITIPQIPLGIDPNKIPS